MFESTEAFAIWLNDTNEALGCLVLKMNFMLGHTFLMIGICKENINHLVDKC